MQNKLFGFYSDRFAAYAVLLKRSVKISQMLGLFRLVTFALLLALIYFYFFVGQRSGYLWLGIPVLVIFLLFVQWSQKQKKQREVWKNIMDLNENEMKLLTREEGILDNGKRFASDKGYGEDLDLFGQGSLYEMINRAGTPMGEKRLAERLLNPLTDKQQIERKQEAIKDLMQRVDFRQIVTAITFRNRDNHFVFNKLSGLLRMFSYTDKLTSRLALVWPFISLGVVLFSVVNQLIWPFFALIGLSFVVLGFRKSKIKTAYQQVQGSDQLFKQYGEVFSHLSNEDLSSEAGNEMREEAGKAASEVKAFGRIVSFFDQRNNALVYFLFNVLFLYDFWGLFMIERWASRNHQKVWEWFDLIAELEVLSGFASFAYNHPDFVFPEVIEQDSPVFTVEMLGHPLLLPDERVCNNVRMDCAGQLMIVTGSNMSGKSTFLRSVGIASVLAGCGSVVCAAKMIWTPMQVLTSIRQFDNVKEHLSLFMAELERLKKIKEILANGDFALVLVDEMLRGTNSDDKHLGSKEFLQSLTRSNALAVVATHDVQLTTLSREIPEKVSNYYFESFIHDDELTFDYKIKEGVSDNRNATFLMKKMGIIV